MPHGPSLIGRDLIECFDFNWLEYINNKIERCHNVLNVKMANLCEKFPNPFDESSVGKLNTMKVHLRVNDENPKFCKARPVPFSIREA